MYEISIWVVYTVYRHYRSSVDRPLSWALPSVPSVSFLIPLWRFCRPSVCVSLRLFLDPSLTFLSSFCLCFPPSPSWSLSDVPLSVSMALFSQAAGDRSQSFPRLLLGAGAAAADGWARSPVQRAHLPGGADQVCCSYHGLGSRGIIARQHTGVYPQQVLR